MQRLSDIDSAGRAIQIHRVSQGLSRRDLAELAGVSYSYLSEVETNRKPPSRNLVNKLSRALSLTETELLNPISGVELRIDQLSGSGIRGRVLWVDDHPEWNIQETLALESQGYAVSQATDTETAQSYLMEVRFNLVITDVTRGNNPRAGLELLDWLGANVPGVPFLVYAGSGSEREKAVANFPSVLLSDPDAIVNSALAVLAAVSRARL